MINVFGKDHDVVGSLERDLILKTNGKIKILVGKKFIDLLDLKGNINVPTKSPINSAKTPKEASNSGLGFYIMDGNLFVNIDGQIIQITGLELLYLKYKEALELNLSEIDIVQKNIGLKFDTLEEAYKVITKGIVNIDGDLYYILDNEEEPKKLNIDLSEPLSAINDTELGLPSGDCFIANIDGRWCYCPLKNYGESKVVSVIGSNGVSYVSFENPTDTNENNGTTRGYTSGEDDNPEELIIGDNLPISFNPLWYSKEYYIKNGEFDYEASKTVIKNLVTIPRFDLLEKDICLLSIQLVKVDFIGIASLTGKENITVLRSNNSYSTKFLTFRFIVKNYTETINNVQVTKQKLEYTALSGIHILKGVLFKDGYKIDALSLVVNNDYEEMNTGGTWVFYIILNNEYYVLGLSNNNPLVGNTLFVQVEDSDSLRSLSGSRGVTSGKLRTGIGPKLVLEENFTSENALNSEPTLNPIVYIGDLSDTSEYLENSSPFNTYYGYRETLPNLKLDVKTIDTKKIDGNNTKIIEEKFGIYAKLGVFNGLEIRGKWPLENNFDITDLPRYSTLLSNYLLNYLNVNTNGLTQVEIELLYQRLNAELSMVIPNINWIKTKFLSEPLNSINNAALGAPTLDNVTIGWKDGAWKYLSVGSNNGNFDQSALNKAIKALHILGTIQFYPVTVVNNVITTCIPSGLALCDGKNGTEQVTNLIIDNGIKLAYVLSIDYTCITFRLMSSSYSLNTTYSIRNAYDFLDYVTINDQYQNLLLDYVFTLALAQTIKFYYKLLHNRFSENLAYSSGCFYDSTSNRGFPAFTIHVNNKITYISLNAFKNTGATEVTLPDSIISIGSGALDTGGNLTLNIRATTPPSLELDAIPNYILIINVPSGYASVYRSAPGWSNFSNRIN